MKILKIKVGEVFIDGKNYPVFNAAFPKKSKNGDTYYVKSEQIFVQEVKDEAVEDKPKATL